MGFLFEEQGKVPLGSCAHDKGMATCVDIHGSTSQICIQALVHLEHCGSHLILT